MSGRKLALRLFASSAALVLIGCLNTEHAAGDESVLVATDEQERFFESSIRPLLAEACGGCHGAKKSESGLRLDNRDAMLIGGDSGSVLNLSMPGESLLLQAVSYEGEVKMPPDKRLTDSQLELLRLWVQQGAPWPSSSTRQSNANPMGLRSGPITDVDRSHWAYQPILKPLVPEPKVNSLVAAANDQAHDLAQWADTDIDRFVLAKMIDQGLRPGPDADQRQWLRRLCFDLTGLPPTPAEMHAFLADATPHAIGNAIDRLLEKPQYGERWGRHWLDLVRYADTAGDGADYPIREAYKYRDYVIHAFNTDKPYDQFVREQVAGDILAHQAASAGTITPEEFASHVIATGYLAITKRFGYNINTEFQHLDIADTLDNLGQSFLGLSIGCARCHDHKYDAITADDYYALYGIFASSQFSFPGGEEYKKPHNLVPLALPSEVAAAQQQTASRLAELDAQAALLQQQRDEWIAQVQMGVSRDPGWELQTPSKPGTAPWFTAGPNTILAEAQSPYDHVYPLGSQGIRISHGKPTDGIRQEFADVSAAKTAQFHFNLDFRNVEAVAGSGAYRLYLGRGAIQSLAIECSIDSHQISIRNGDQFQVVRKLEPGVWYNLQLDIDMVAKTFSGRVGRPGDVVEFVDYAAAPGWDGVLNTFVSDGYGQDQSASPQRDFDNVVGQFEPFNALTVAGQDATDQSVANTAHAHVDFSGIQKQLLELVVQSDQLAKSRQEMQTIDKFPLAYGVSEGKPANARIQRRGEPTRLGDEVPRRFLDILGGDVMPPESSGSGRLELAHWLTRDTNPLTARVLVNRVWQQLFGRGLVDTPNDFGTRGSLPTHPELLDFLAAEFVQDGWSIKRLQRRILTSHIYRLASAPTADHIASDPDNRWFARHRRRPLDAESIRDAMLSVGGKLNLAPAGPHPFPPVESWKFTIHYPFHAVYDSDHRSVYLMIQRARRHPYLALFDAADPNISTATRQVTVTPTQSLYLMNAPLVHAQASGLAERILEGIPTSIATSSNDSTELRIRHAYELLFGRQPTQRELDQAKEFLQQSLAVLGGDVTTKQEHSPWEAFCRVLITSNEFLYVD